MIEGKAQEEELELETDSQRPIVVYCHEKCNATININSVHHHHPDWLNLDAILKFVREIKGER